MKKLYLIIFISTYLFSSSQDDFLKTLNETSEIATNSRLNINKIPSNIEVINREFIIKSGARTLIDLLKYVPGIEISINQLGKKEIIVRGNKNVYRDKIKFLINGHEVTNNLFSNQFYYYNFPADLIKRIEITKTPDAVLYGNKAYLGIINIVTLDELNDNQFSFYQSNKKQSTITLFDKLNKNLVVDLHYEISDPNIKATTTKLVDIDKNFQQKSVRTNKPNELEKESGIGIRYKKENSTLSYRIQFFKKANFFGLINLPPLKTDKYENFMHQYLNYNYSNFLTTNIKNSLDVGIKNYIWKSSYRAFPEDFNFSNSESDIISGGNIQEYETYIKNITTYNSDKHTANFIVEMKYSKPYKNEYYQIDTNSSVNRYLFGNKKVDRKFYSLGINDLVIIKNYFNIMYGIRYSHYNDFGGDFSYKLGSVYNLNKETTFKLLYNTAFRAPSWVEMYSKTIACFNGNNNLKAEKIGMLEFTYLQKLSATDKLRATLYKGKATRYIGKDWNNEDNKVYSNLGDLIIQGFEIDYKKNYKQGKFNINYSYNANKALFSINKNNIDYYKYLGNRKHLIKGYNIYDLNKRFSFFSGIIYGSKINLPMNYYLDEYFSLNTNLIYKKDNYEIRLGVNNLTNHKNYYLSMPTDLVQTDYFFIQQDAKIPLEGRKIYISLMKKF